MVNALKLMEEKMYDNNVQCLNTLKPLLPPVTESLDGLKSGEEEGCCYLCLTHIYSCVDCNVRVNGRGKS